MQRPRAAPRSKSSSISTTARASSRLDQRRRIVAAADVGARHHTAVGQLACAFRESIAGWYPARVAHDAIRDALSDAGWDQARFDAEWADVTAWALGQVKHLDKLTAAAEIANRAYNEKVDALEEGYPAGYIDSIVAESSRDLTDDQLDAWLTAPNQPADIDTSSLPVPIDWHALYARENRAEWFVDDVWPAGRQLHIFAARKTGKSLLMLWIAACLAVGRDPFSGRHIPPVIVIYLDYEMTEDDLLERLEEMGFTAEQLTGKLIYYLWPTLPAMDTDAGGRRLVELVERDGGQAVILDTFSRVVEGEENSADTYRAFFTFTGMRLKRRGIPMARLDHEGHEGGRSRGSSAKADDVDVVWRLARTDDGLQLIRQASRMSWVPERVQLRQGDPSATRGSAGHGPPARSNSSPTSTASAYQSRPPAERHGPPCEAQV